MTEQREPGADHGSISKLLRQSAGEIPSVGAPVLLGAGTGAAESFRPIRGRRLYAPLTAASAYLGGTFLAFLVVGDIHKVPSLGRLSFFIVMTLVAFALGYHAKARRYSAAPPESHLATPDRDLSAGRWVALSGLYYLLFGIALLQEYGASGPLDVFNAITSPGQAYAAKYRIYAEQSASGEANPIVQILTLLSVLYAPLVPFAILYWRRLTLAVRLVALAGTITYAAFFLFIGTMKGFGDLMVFAIASTLVLVYGNWLPERRRRIKRRTTRIALVLILLVLTAYMTNSQSQRQLQFGIAGRIEPNPVAAAVMGESAARGLTSVLKYPTDGYLGLAYNLDTPFEWTQMRGSSRAIDSYWAQYTGAESVFEATYPARTEARTGWPALMYWSTAYPWFASDLTYPGTVLMMGVAGWFLCRMWYEAAFEKRRLSVLLFAQLALFIAFIPANNQIGTGRPSLITFFSLLALYGLSRVPPPRGHRS